MQRIWKNIDVQTDMRMRRAYFYQWWEKLYFQKTRVSDSNDGGWTLLTLWTSVRLCAANQQWKFDIWVPVLNRWGNNFQLGNWVYICMMYVYDGQSQILLLTGTLNNIQRHVGERAETKFLTHHAIIKGE